MMITGGIKSSSSSSSSTVNGVRTAVDRRSTVRRVVGGRCGNRTYVNALLIAAITLSCFAVHDIEAFIVKRSFLRIGCMGHYDKAVFGTVDRICEECHNLYREPGLHTLCRSECFRNEYFGGCVKALLLSDKQDEISVMVNKLYGGSK